jgi:hypothetical protein
MPAAYDGARAGPIKRLKRCLKTHLLPVPRRRLRAGGAGSLGFPGKASGPADAAATSVTTLIGYNPVFLPVELAVQILDYAHAHGRVTTRDMVREHGASPNTRNVTFRNLVAKNMLAWHGAGRSTWYSLP